MPLVYTLIVLRFYSILLKSRKTRLQGCGCKSARKSGLMLVAWDYLNKFSLTILLHIAPRESKQFNSVWNHRVKYCTKYASRKNYV